MDTTEPKGKYTLVKNGNSELRMCPWNGFVRLTIEDGLATSFYLHAQHQIAGTQSSKGTEDAEELGLDRV